MNAALPELRMSIDGRDRTVLVDSGSTCSIIYAPCCKSWVPGTASVLSVSGQSMQCRGVGRMTVGARYDACGVEVAVYVVDFKPLGFDCILGMNGILALGGVSISSPSSVCFGAEVAATCSAVLGIDRDDFRVRFDGDSKAWTVNWNWSSGQEPGPLRNRVAEYSVAAGVRSEYEMELEKWIAEGWLRPYDEEKLGPARGLIPLLAVVQLNKEKVRPVMDFRELNSHVEALTADADVCAERLRQWRRRGVNTSMIDLKTAYMQIHVDEALWPYQTVVFRGRRFCLTRLGFGLSIAPAVMKAVLNKVLEQDEQIRKAASPYVDDIYVDNDVASAEQVRDHLALYGLICKPPESVSDGARVLGLWVSSENGQLRWKRCNELPDSPRTLTRRAVFSWGGKLLSHLPVCAWLRPAVAFIKRRANALSEGWDDEVTDTSLRHMIEETAKRISEEDPAKGRWDVSGDEATIWADASSLALGAAVAVGDCIIEDASWLRSEDGGHINMAELDAVIKGVNMALTWQMRRLQVKTDSKTVFHWISDALSGRSRLRTKASGEMLIRRRLSILTSLVEEYNLQVNIALVPSAMNRADALTRVPHEWLKARIGSRPPSVIGAVLGSDPENEVAAVHHASGHQGTDRSLYFARRAQLSVTKGQVREVVAKCSRCQSIDPAPVRWKRGKLSVRETWIRVGMDVTHYEGQHYLTLVDHGPSRFSIWKSIRRQDTSSIVQQLENLFFERGAPEELLTDNDTAFRSLEFQRFAEKWGVRVRFRCAYVPSGNGITERCHRTVKRIAARKGCSIQEAVYWYNVAPKDGVTQSAAPANQLHNYSIRLLGIDKAPPNDNNPHDSSPFRVGDVVWVKPQNSRCTTQFTLGRVSKIISEQAIEVDGMPRHVRDLRPVVSQDDERADASVRSESGEDSHIEDAPLFVTPTPVAEMNDNESYSTSDDDEPVALRRASRNAGPPHRYGVEVDSHLF